MIEILDTTLRDGEQTAGVSFSMQEKLSLAHLLLSQLNIDRLEVASAKVSNLEFETVKRIVKLAKDINMLDRIEVLGFIDKGVSAQWIYDTGCKTINILAKGSHNHTANQLNKSTEEHISDIIQEVTIAKQLGLNVNLYLEDWSNGIANSSHVYELMDKLKDLPINRFMLCDTLGVLNPHTTWRYCKNMQSRYPNLHFDFHAHNDYDLAVANSMVAAELRLGGLHVTMNGLGERAGNTPLASIVAALHDQLNIKTNINEEYIYRISQVAETYSGHRIGFNQPIVGSNVFTQCAGIHADGDRKKKLYQSDLTPERFGRAHEYALGKLSGNSNIEQNLVALGIELSPEDRQKVTQKVIELGAQKELVTQEDLPYIITDVLKYEELQSKVKILNFSFFSSKGLRSSATVSIEINGKAYQQTAAGDGQYHAFSKALWKIYNKLDKEKPNLLNYSVIIPPGGQTNAFVQTIISWEYNGKTIKTRGLDTDQITSAVKATERMLNYMENIL